MGLNLVIFAIVIIVILAALVYIGMRQDDDKDPLADRLAQYGDRDLPSSLDEVELSIGMRERIVDPFIKGIANFVVKLTPEKQLEAVRQKVELAGETTDPAQIFLKRIVFLILLGIGGAVISSQLLNKGLQITLLATLGGAWMGYYMPMSSLNAKIKKRQAAILRALPDALDLLVICVEAGLGFDMAMGKVYEKWDNELALAFGRVLREIQLGKLRREALRDMAARTDVPDVNAFIAAIVQADQLGVGMANVLRVQSEQMRVKRRQRAQEKAQQAPVKMLIPMVFLIFPSIFVVLLGPAVIIVMESGALAVF
jgi:tight adherence protein C